MRLPSQKGLKLVLLAAALVFCGALVYLYGLHFFDWIESDASVSVLLADKALQSKSPVVRDWYYANGDIWVFAPHWFALLPVALFGIGHTSLWLAVVSGFAVEVVAYVQLFGRLAQERWVGLLATMVTLMAWSHAHVAFVYIQLAYGFLTVLYLMTFTAFGTFAVRGAARRWHWVPIGGLVLLLAVQNPTRGIAFVVTPLLFACVWPWREHSLARRATIAVAAIGGWIAALAIYRGLAHVVAFSVPRGHLDFVVRDAAGIVDNIQMLGAGLLMLCGGGETLDLRAIPGVLVMAGACLLVGRELFASRALTTVRFVVVVLAAQAGVTLLPLVLGNLLVAPVSVRYLMPTLLAVYGMAAILAARTVGEPGATMWRRIAWGWLGLVPVAALVALPNLRPPTPAPDIWPARAELRDVGAALSQRHLTHGFSSVITANILNLEAHGEIKTCPIFFANTFIPQRWLADTSCFTASALPAKFFVVSEHTDHNIASLRATLPAPAERFSVGDTYDISVFRTASVSLAWLDLPLPDGEDATFPLRLPMTHLQVRRGNATVEGNHLIATGKEDGYVQFGPYMKLPRGHYSVRWTGRGIDSPGIITFIVAADVGKHELIRVELPAKDIGDRVQELSRLSFKLGRPRENVEFTVFSAGGARIELDEIVLERHR